VLAQGMRANHAFVTNKSGVIVRDWNVLGRHVVGQDLSLRSYFRQGVLMLETVDAGVSLNTGKRMIRVHPLLCGHEHLPLMSLSRH